ncbi:MAG: adenylate cyclase [Bacteroidia bacterium]
MVNESAKIEKQSASSSFRNPSIAVLPFVSMSHDVEKEFFADGMTEDIITGLSCDSRLTVVARNSTFTYKGQSVDIRTVGSDLGVRYVLEGSIRPVGDRMRITLQLIETDTGSSVWADKMDRPIAELFHVQGEVVEIIVTTLCANLGIAESTREQRQRPEDLNAWALCAQAEVLLSLSRTEKPIRKLRHLLDERQKLSPVTLLAGRCLTG